MTRWVVDSCVAAKWVLPESGEPWAKEAGALLAAGLMGKCQLLAPDFFWAEICNVLWKSERLGRISKARVREACRWFESLPVELLPSRGITERALELAMEHDRAVYDALYVALAVREKCQLVTSDEELYRALPRELPVMWLGDWR